MTAEIALLNPHGVALAADSAVTVGTQKIINSAIKLFALSKTEPVGIMIYGNANLLHIPWETLIKIYRKEHSKSYFDKLCSYGESFIDFLRSKIPLFNDESQNQWFENQLTMLYKSLADEFERRKSEFCIHNPNMLNLELKKAILQDLIDRMVSLHEQEDNTWPTEKTTEGVETYINLIVPSIINFFFAEFDQDEDIKKKLIKLALLTITKNGLMGGNSGIVIAGFGDHDIFPSLMTYQISGIFENELIYKIIKDKTIINNNEEDMLSGVIAFAQEDVVLSFLRGIHSDLHNFTIKYMHTLITGLLEDKYPKPLNQAQVEDLNANVMQIVNGFDTSLSQQVKQTMLNPMIDMIRVLPKDELAAMAETLVNITAFKRKMAYSSLETVGGPIDVAVISKGDGLVWIKRKQYFPANLNKPFFDNYFREQK